jgi:hypothetical protein
MPVCGHHSAARHGGSAGLAAGDGGGADELEVASAGGDGVGVERVQGDERGLVAGDHELAGARVRHVVGPRPRVEQRLSAETGLGLDRAGWVVEAAVDHAAVAAGDAGAGADVTLEHDDRAAAAGERRGDRTADDTGADDRDVHPAIVSTALPRVAGASYNAARTGRWNCTSRRTRSRPTGSGRRSTRAGTARSSTGTATGCG